MRVIISDNKGNRRAINVLPTITINEGKSKLWNVENRVWMYNEVVLNGNQTFGDYGVEDGDMIMERVKESNECIKITIMENNGNRKMFSVSKSETIKEAKSKLGEGKSIWLFNGISLDENKTFKDYRIENGDQILCMLTMF